MDLKKLTNVLNKFINERDWETHHSPKNLVMALTGEVGELNECFQWLNEKQIEELKNDPDKMVAVEHEVADVFIYLFRLSQKMNINFEKAVYKKIELNKQKYPINSNKSEINKV